MRLLRKYLEAQVILEPEYKFRIEREMQYSSLYIYFEEDIPPKPQLYDKDQLMDENKRMAEKILETATKILSAMGK